MGEDINSKDIRRKIFFEELVRLKHGKYINEQEYGYVVKKYNKYYINSNKDTASQEVLDTSIYENNNIEIAEDISSSEPNKRKTSKENIRIENHYKKINEERRIKSKKVIREKKIITAEDIRERNLTILLILGTLFIFVAGLTFATTTWNIIGDVFKTIILILMGTIFFGISVFCGKVLKINKTSFAFWGLGTLFLPLSLLSIKFLGLMGNYLSFYGEGTYLFNVISGLICLPVFYYSFKKYNQNIYSYVGVITVDFLIINSGLAVGIENVYTILLISSFNLALIYLNNFNEKFKELKMSRLILVNIIISFILLGMNLTNSYIFYFNILVIAGIFLYLNYVNKEVIEIYSIGSANLIAIGFAGCVGKFIVEYFEEVYLLSIPVMLLGIYYFIFVQFKNNFTLKDKYIFNFSMRTGLLSILSIAAVAPFYNEYKLFTIIILLINSIGLIYINLKEGGKVYNYFVQGSLVVVIGSLSYLMDINLKFIDANLRKAIIVFLLFGIWILLKKIKLLEKVYKGMIFSFYGYSIVYLGLSIADMNISNIFNNLIFISLISLYGYKENIIKQISLVATVIASYLVLVSSYLKVVSIYKDYNIILHMVIVSAIIIGAIYIYKYKFKIYYENSKYLVIVNNILSLFMVAAVHVINMKNDLTTNFIFIEILLIINIGYYLYNYKASKQYVYPSFIVFNFGVLVYYIGYILNYNYSYYIGIIGAVVVMFSLYLYYKNDEFKNKNIIDNMYLFVAMTIGLGDVNSIVLNIITMMIIIGALIIAYKEKNIILNALGILGSIYLTNIILVNLFTDESVIFMVYVVLIIGLRMIGLKIYKGIFNENKLDVLTIISSVFVIMSSEYLYVATGFKEDLNIFIILTLVSLLLIVEIIRVKKYRSEIIMYSQLILSVAIYFGVLYLNLTFGATSKVCMALAIGLYITYKILWKDKFSKIADIVIAIVFTLLLFADIFISDTVINNIIMSVVVIIIISIFMIKENKMLLNIAVGDLLLILLFASRAFIFSLIFSIPWWAYLLITGSCFVGGAIYLEKKRNKNSK